MERAEVALASPQDAYYVGASQANRFRLPEARRFLQRFSEDWEDWEHGGPGQQQHFWQGIAHGERSWRLLLLGKHWPEQVAARGPPHIVAFDSG